MEKQVRLLLHRARKPDQLAAHPLSRAICTALACADPALALRKVVEEAFSEEHDDEVRLRTLVLRCDIEGSVSLTEACSELAYSRRHFQRYRAQAVTIIARHLHKLLDPTAIDAPHRSPLEALAAIVAEREPQAASRIYDIAGGTAHARTELLALQAQVAAGEELTEADIETLRHVPRPLALALAAQSQELCGKSSVANDLVSRIHFQSQQAGSFDPGVAFELEWLRFLRAQHRNEASAAAASARALDRLATDRQKWRSRATTALAYAALVQGDFEGAARVIGSAARMGAQAHDLRGLADATLLDAELAFIGTDLERASQLASAASVALAHRPRESNLCAALLGRIALARNAPWSEPASSALRHPGAWDRMLLEAIGVRHRLARGEASDALHAAEAGFERANYLGYRGVAAYHAATRAACVNDPTSAEARSWALRALGEFAGTQDHALAADLFPSALQSGGDLGALAVDNDLTSIFFERLAVIVPQIAGESPAQRTAVRRLLTTMIAFTADRIGEDRLVEAVEKANALNTALAHYAHRASEQLEQSLSLMLPTLVPPTQRPTMRARVRHAMGTVLGTLRPGTKRVVLVG